MSSRIKRALKSIFTTGSIDRKILRSALKRVRALQPMLALLFFISLIGGVSVVGLLQSSERIYTSGIVVRPATPPPSPISLPASTPPPLPPEPEIEIDLYYDSGCTEPLSSVDWGSIEAGGSTKQKIYVKNSGDESVTLSLSAENWTPSKASNYIDLTWNYNGKNIGPGAVIEVTLTLTVDPSISGIDTFDFDIIVIGSAS